MLEIEKILNDLCPDGVQYLPLSEIATFRRGSFPQPYTNTSFYGGEGAMPFVQVADMQDSSRDLKPVTKQTISKIAQPKSIFVKKGTVLVSIQGTIGRVAIAQYDCYVDRTIAIFDEYKVEIDKKYFAYQLEVKFGIEKEFARGSTLKTITKEEFAKFQIPLPPLAAQREIVRVLDKFTLLSRELAAELAARRVQYEYYRDTLLNSPQEIKKYKLEEIAEIYDGTHQTPEYQESGIQFVSVENINDLYGSTKYISEEAYKEYKIRPQVNDVFMTRIGSIGVCNVVDRNDDLAYYVSLALIRPNTNVVNAKYLKYIIESGIGKKELNKWTLFHAVPIKINKNDIGKIVLPIPSMDVQERLVYVLENFDKICSDLKIGLPAEIEKRQQQYEYYRDKLLTFDNESATIFDRQTDRQTDRAN